MHAPGTPCSGELSFPRYSSTPIETYGVIAHWEREGTGDQVTAWCNFHGPFTMQPVIAGALGLQPGRVRLIVPEDIGGSFGIKSGVYAYVALMAIASRYAGAPVRWIEDRIEHLLASSAGTDREMEFEAAVDQDGRITALRLDLIDNVGAYLRPPEPATLYRCFGNLTGAYAIHAVALRSRAVVTNKAPTGLNRGFGGQQLYFGLERLMDKIAALLGLDPVELRRRNLIDPGDSRTPRRPAVEYDSGNYQVGPRPGPQNAGYDERCATRPGPQPGRGCCGVGIATIVDPSGTNLGYVGIATPPEARKPGREKSGSTELRPGRRRRRRRGDGDARATAAGPGPQDGSQAGGGRPPWHRAGARPRGGRDGHRDDTMDGLLGQLLEPVRAC